MIGRFAGTCSSYSQPSKLIRKRGKGEEGRGEHMDKKEEGEMGKRRKIGEESIPRKAKEMPGTRKWYKEQK